LSHSFFAGRWKNVEIGTGGRGTAINLNSPSPLVRKRRIKNSREEPRRLKLSLRRQKDAQILLLRILSYLRERTEERSPAEGRKRQA